MKILYHHRTQGEEPESVHIANIVTSLRRHGQRQGLQFQHQGMDAQPQLQVQDDGPVFHQQVAVAPVNATGAAITLMRPIRRSRTCRTCAWSW